MAEVLPHLRGRGCAGLASSTLGAFTNAAVLGRKGCLMRINFHVPIDKLQITA